MLIGKLKKIQIRQITQEEQLGFHLDDQQAAVALQAKKQLEACSQQIVYDYTKQQIICPRKECSWGANLNDSTRTRASQNQKKSTFRKSNIKPARKQSCKKCQNHSASSRDKQKTDSPQNKQLTMSSINLHPEFQNNNSELVSTFSQIKHLSQYISNKNKKQYYSGHTFRSFSAKPQVKQNLKKYRLYTARRQKNPAFFQQYGNASSRKLYSFNETIGGSNNYISDLKKYKLLSKSEPKSLEKSRIKTSIQAPKIDLRPEFLRLIMKIKQKEQEKCSKKLMIKGNRNRI